MPNAPLSMNDWLTEVNLIGVEAYLVDSCETLALMIEASLTTPSRYMTQIDLWPLSSGSIREEALRVQVLVQLILTTG